MDDKLQKAINLSRKTGDRLIIFDYARSNDPFVVLSMDEYEKMALGSTDVRGLTEDELLDRINRNIAVWKTEQNDVGFNLNAPENKMDDDDEELDDIDDINDFSDEFDDYKEEVMGESALDQTEPKKKWSIPKDRKEAAEEIIEEDRQYLEEIPY